MFVFLLFAAAFAEKAYIKEIEQTPKIFYKIVPGDCNYAYLLGAEVWFKVENENGKPKIYSYNKTKCEGDKKEEKDDSSIAKNLLGTLKDAPPHIAFKNMPDREGCPNEKYALRVYMANECFYDKGESVGYEINDGWLWLQGYSDEKCGKKKDNEKQKIFQCDTCFKEVGQYIKTQCGSVATMILAVFFVIAFLF